jgi:2-dehydropantoate 2-reductase
MVEFGREAGADVRLNAKLCEMIYEIEEGKRALGFHNYDELEAYVASIGKALP